MKNQRNGQATPLDREKYLRIRKGFMLTSHQLYFDLAWFTAERPSAILALRVSDVYSDTGKRKLHGLITFPGRTRKTGDTRQVPIAPDLADRLTAYNPPTDGYLFPSEKRSGPLSLRAMDRAFRRALERSGMEGKGYSLYSTRRGALTALREKGFDLKAIQSFSGHKSLGSLGKYIDVSEESVKEMIKCL